METSRLMADFSWLPNEFFKQKNASEVDYIEALYSIFSEDFITNPANFRGQKLALKKHPKKDNKEATFWHMITEGKDESKRTINNQRASKLPWVKPVILNEAKNEIKVWENIRKSETRIVLWLEKKDYVVILAKRKGYILPWTAYSVTYTHTKQKLLREYNAYIKQKTPR